MSGNCAAAAPSISGPRKPLRFVSPLKAVVVGGSLLKQAQTSSGIEPSTSVEGIGRTAGINHAFTARPEPTCCDNEDPQDTVIDESSSEAEGDIETTAAYGYLIKWSCTAQATAPGGPRGQPVPAAEPGVTALRPCEPAGIGCLPP